MSQKIIDSASEYIDPIQINGLDGRMLTCPPTKKNKNRRILLIYGHHGMLERWWSLVQNLSDYGTVTMPDLPGFGGMDSFYKIGKKPTIDAFADYLASFIKMRYRRGKFTIVAISFGFTVVTRMLQKYPDIAKRAELVVSIAGFTHYDDFSFSKRQRLTYSFCTWLLSARIPAFITHSIMNHYVLDKLYRVAPASKARFKLMPADEARGIIDMETRLWRVNDMRTHWLTTSEFLRIDNCKYGKVESPTWHVTHKDDFYFDNEVVEQHMQIIFNDYHRIVSKAKHHTPSVIGDKADASSMVPAKLRRLLNK